MSAPTFHELRLALAIEELILNNLTKTTGFDHPAQQSTRGRITALEQIIQSQFR